MDIVYQEKHMSKGTGKKLMCVTKFEVEQKVRHWRALYKLLNLHPLNLFNSNAED